MDLTPKCSRARPNQRSSLEVTHHGASALNLHRWKRQTMPGFAQAPVTIKALYSRPRPATTPSPRVTGSNTIQRSIKPEAELTAIDNQQKRNRKGLDRGGHAAHHF